MCTKKITQISARYPAAFCPEAPCPLEITDVRDLHDNNVVTFDEFSVGPDPNHVDRLDEARKKPVAWRVISQFCYVILDIKSTSLRVSDSEFYLYCCASGRAITPHSAPESDVRCCTPDLFQEPATMMRPMPTSKKRTFYPKPVSFRKSIDSLSALIEPDIKVAVFALVLFVFLNRPRNQVKTLYRAPFGSSASNPSASNNRLIAPMK